MTKIVTDKVEISVVIITLNEEKNISRCLESVQWADDIVVVDSGSTDTTCDIARSLNASVIHNDWPGFGKQKQFATAQAKHDWVLSLDADEWLSNPLSDEIIKVIENLPKHHVYNIRRRHYFMGRLLRYGIAYPDDVLRLFNRQHANWNANPVHESISHPGQIGFIPGDLLHESAPTLGRFVEKLNQYTDIQAAERFSKGKRAGLIQLFLLPLWQFFRGYFFKLGFLDGVPGFVHNAIAAMNTFLRYAKTQEKYLLASKNRLK